VSKVEKSEIRRSEIPEVFFSAAACFWHIQNVDFKKIYTYKNVLNEIMEKISLTINNHTKIQTLHLITTSKTEGKLKKYTCHILKYQPS